MTVEEVRRIRPVAAPAQRHTRIGISIGHLMLYAGLPSTSVPMRVSLTRSPHRRLAVD